MTIGQSIKEGFHYARSCTSLWAFGFIVGMASGGSSGGGTGGGSSSGGDGLDGFPFALSIADFPPVIYAILSVVAVIALVAIIAHFISQGALIEGVVRARQGRRLTIVEAFRAGVAHWGVPLRIALLYFAAVIGSIALLVMPCVLAFRAFGAWGGVAFGLPALLLAVPSATGDLPDTPGDAPDAVHEIDRACLDGHCRAVSARAAWRPAPQSATASPRAS